jgi:uncharacterized protein YidB (DUF937 family)
MGILDDLLASATSGQGGGLPTQRPQRGAGGGPNAALLALLPIVLSMLANRGGSGSSGRDAGPAGGLGDILGQMMGGGQRGGGGGGLGDILGQVLGGGGGSGGGLGGLLRQFESAGLADQARSWVSPGQNQSLSPDALGRVFGADGLAAIARQAGLSERETTAGLAQLLPEIIDRATPQGQVPDEDQLAGTLQDLMRRLGA